MDNKLLRLNAQALNDSYLRLFLFLHILSSSYSIFNKKMGVKQQKSIAIYKIIYNIILILYYVRMYNMF